MKNSILDKYLIIFIGVLLLNMAIMVYGQVPTIKYYYAWDKKIPLYPSSERAVLRVDSSKTSINLLLEAIGFNPSTIQVQQTDSITYYLGSSNINQIISALSVSTPFLGQL